MQRVPCANGVVIYQSPRLLKLGVAHAFSTRLGGVSPPPFDSLNLGNPPAGRRDSPGNIAANYRRLAEAIGAADVTLARVRQEHGNVVALLRGEGESERAQKPEAEIRNRFAGQTPADAIITNRRAVLLSMQTADCAAILFCSDNGAVVAAVHAGWRGVVCGVVGRAVTAMEELGVPPRRCVAAIGPAIGVEHFEVGPEVAAKFQAVDLAPAVITDKWPNPHVDLAGAIDIQLRRAGLREVDCGRLCTFVQKDDFFSHRRDGGITGRMGAVIRAAC